MYGLGKKDKGAFEFDLEKELKSDPNKMKELLKKVEGRVQEIKTALRQGSGSEEFDKLGVVLHGYTALQRVLTKLANKK
ncbi:MAG: DUF5398 family protein [Verrucomicrobia bacterium]|nr:DUF5398 family protein [Verrucomicrobiota bacterium]